jgi:hypothetical protein
MVRRDNEGSRAAESAAVGHEVSSVGIAQPTNEASSVAPREAEAAANSPATTGSPDTLDFLTHVHKYLQDQIVLADAKAAVAAGIAAGLFVAFREITRGWTFVGWTDGAAVLRGALQILLLLALLMTVTYVYRALAPRMPARYRHLRGEAVHRAIEAVARSSSRIDREEGGVLVRWPDLADRTIYASPSAYADGVLAADTQKLRRNIAEHAMVLAQIVAEKHQDVRAVVNYLLVAGLTVAVLSLLAPVGH